MVAIKKAALTMLAGAAVAQAISLIVMPVLTRIYSPAEFGVLSAFVAAGAVLAVISSARFELAIVLPANVQDARYVGVGALGLAASICGLVLTVIVAARIVVSDAREFSSLTFLGQWLYAVPVLAFLIACGQVASFWATRQKEYGRIAQSSVLQQLVASAVAVVLAALKFPLNGLVFGRLAGQLSVVLRLWSELRAITAGFGMRAIFARSRAMAMCMFRYRQFPLFNMPYSLIGTFSREFLVLALTMSQAVVAAGYYALARAVVSAPISLLSGSLSPVFYREAAERYRSLEFRKLTYRLFLGSALVLAPGYMWFVCWGQDIFVEVFGERWRGSGYFASIFAIPTTLSLVTSWPERIFEVTNRQHWSLGIQVTFDASTIAIVSGVLLRGDPPEMAVFWYAVCMTGYHLCYLAVVFYLTGLGTARYLNLLALICMEGIVVWLCGWLLLNWLRSTGIALLAHLFIVLCISVSGFALVWRWRFAEGNQVGER